MNSPTAVVTAFVLTDEMPPIRTSDPWALAELVMSVHGAAATDPGPEVPPPLRLPRPGEPPTPIIPDPIVPEPIIPDPLPPQPEHPEPNFDIAV
jgi:hypothetical protein